MMQEVQNKAEVEKVFLVGADTGEDANFEQSMEELINLAKACDLEPAGCMTQVLPMENKALCLGSGKVLEVKQAVEEAGAKMVIFDNTLSPIQLRNLQRELELPVMDRTGLILDIFSRRAKTKEAKLQVETARLQYMLPRLVGMREALSRQGGASGSMSSKGAGEKKLELDRRKLEQRMVFLRRELEEIARERKTQSKKRVESRTPKVALVGYTNAGKSTIMNRMVEQAGMEESKKVLEKDMLFATLETTVRLIEQKNNRNFFLSDTVGFIHKLPHGLIKAFRATLEEVRNADLLLQVVDFSDPDYKQQMEVTRTTLEELEAGGIPVLYVYNKVDLKEGKYPVSGENNLYISARNEKDIERLRERIVSSLYKDYVTREFLFPYEKGGMVSYFSANALVLEQKYVEEGVRLVVNCHPSDSEKYREFRIS